MSVLIRVQVKTNSKTQEIQLEDNQLVIRVKSSPVKEKANKEIIAFISKRLDIRKSAITIIKGMISSSKLIKIQGVNLNEIKFKLNSN